MKEAVKTAMKEAEVAYNPHTSQEPDIAPEHKYATAPAVPTTSTTDFCESIEDLAKATTAMEKTAALKRMEAIAKEKQAELVGATNREFHNLRTNNPGKNQFVVNDCVFKNYTKPASYDYPEEVMKMEAEWKKAKKSHVKNGTALRKEAKLDIDTDKTFSVSPIP